MSKTRWISALAASVVFLAAACWLVTGAFPLAAAPQMVSDAPGVAVELGGTQLMHRTAVAYPVAAIAKGVQGTVVAQVKLDANGVVADASIVSGPDELRKAVLQSVLNWHFSKDAGGGTRQVSVTFELPKANVGGVLGGIISSAGVGGSNVSGVSGGVGEGVGGGVSGGIKGGIAGVRGGVYAAPNQGNVVQDSAAQCCGTLKVLIVNGISEQAKADLLARLPVHEGDTLTREVLDKTVQSVKEFDEHLQIAVDMHNGNALMQISLDEHIRVGPVETPKRIRVGGNVQAVNLVTQVKPVYPPEAKQAGVQGTVELQAVIGKDGRVQDIKVLSGHPLLAAAALDAVKNWVYRPTLLNGEPVEVSTTIDVNFTLQ